MKAKIEDIIFYFAPICTKCGTFATCVGLDIEMTITEILESGVPVCTECGTLLDIHDHCEVII